MDRNEAIKIVKSHYPANKQMLNEALEFLIPELAESEGERIRKEIIDFLWKEKIFLQEAHSSVENNPKYRFVMDAIAWLEKQDEQKPIMNVPSREVILSIWDLGNEWKELTNGNISTEYGTQLDYIQKHWHESEYYLREKQGEKKATDKVEPKFENGQWIVWKSQYYKVNDNGCGYELIDQNGLKTSLEYSTVDENAHIFTTQDAKDGDVLCDYHKAYDNPLIFILKKFECVYFGLTRPSDYSSYCFLTASDGQRFKEGTYHHKHNIRPATKEQRDQLERAMTNAGYKWNKEELKLEKI